MDDVSINLKYITPKTVTRKMENGNEFMVLLRKLDLYKYYPGKLQREDVVWLMSEMLEDKNIEKTENLGMIFLNRLISCNYEARDLEIVTECKIQLTEDKVKDPCSTTSRLAKRKQVTPRSGVSQSSAVHPLDVVLSVFLCADPILQQDIASMLWKCKMAIPFVTAISDIDTPFAHVWPLRSILAKWKTIKDGKLIDEEESVLSPSFFTIGFIRFQSTDVEKSIIINTLLSDTDKVHPIFYHRNSKGSTRRRLIADGTVEISWYLPRSSGKTLCSEPITVLNLRGNAMVYERQRKILMEMASLCFIVCSSTDLDNDEVDRIVESVINMKKKVFIITYDDTDNKGMPIIQLEDDVVIFNKESLTDAQLKENVSSRLKEMILKDSLQRTSIDTFLWKEVSVDHERHEIKEGIQYAETIMTSLRCEQTECRKDNLLPLHQYLWEKWVETDKEMYRLKKLPMSQNIKEYKDTLAMEKVYHRKEQFNIVKRGVSRAISSFLNALDINNKIARTVCIRWLKLQMDKLSRKDLIPILEKEAKLSDRNELEKIRELKNKSHIGLEHFFRELGQIYEAIVAQPPTERLDMGYDIPLLAARFLLDGNSLEIFDGDIGAVPITWISAVFERLSVLIKNQTRCPNPKCMVVTVYGMQSSGKSTLMNTMFGCQFNVGAGRCTKGAQIQMLKVNGEEMNVDYIILVDTEGVRSPDVPEEERKTRDNEITTFVIGLGQKTLINLMGENPTYLTDVLPIAVRSFLRMDCVGLKPSCAIVYQNVDPQWCGAMSSQNQKLQKELDKHTHNVCKMEKQDRKRFEDVIKFDIKKDIYCIPTLWEGELPMATVSQGYSKGTLELKNSFHQLLKECESQDLNSYSLHIRSLWTAMTKDDFVYYFQNTLESEAKEKRDKTWCDCVWDLRMEARKYVSNMQTDIINCLDSDKLGEVCLDRQDTTTAQIISACNVQERKLKDFFQGTNKKYKQYMIQWEVSSIYGLIKIRNELIEDIKLYIIRLRRLKESQLLVELKVQEFKEKITKEIDEYFNGVGRQTAVIEDEVPEETIRQLFEEKWKGWSNTVKTIGDKHERRNNMAREAFEILREKFCSHESMVSQKMETLSTDIEFQLQRSHLIGNTKDITQNTLISAQAIVQKTTENARKRLHELTKDPSPYQKGSFEEIIQMVADTQKDLESLGLETTKEFEIESSIALVTMAVSAFSNSENTFLDSFDPSRLLEQEKESFYVRFQKYYKTTSFSLSFAKRVSELLIIANRNRLNKIIDWKVADDMTRGVYLRILNSKTSFIYTILCRLARDEVFSSFMDYIRKPTEVIDYWLGIYVDEYASTDCGNMSKLRSRVNQLILDHINDFTTYVKETEMQLDKTANNIQDMNNTKDIPVTLWVREFTKRASKFEMNKVSGLSDMFTNDTLDFRLFCAELINHINTTTPNVDDLTTKRNASYETMRGNVIKCLRALVVGCTADCPFCGEVCNSSQPDHGGLHETDIHRPQGCHGYRDRKSQVLAEESCQKLVHSTQSFSNNQTNGRFVPYKDYQTIYKSWKIPGNANPRISSFWEWFMCTYISDLEREHKAVRPSIPNEWKTYSKEGEIEKLEKEINK